MFLIERIKSLWRKIRLSVKQLSEANVQNEVSEVSQESLLPIVEDNKIKVENIILEKLNYLEQYIKIFSLNFPNEYAFYLAAIEEQKKLYKEELLKFLDTLKGNLAFAIDPEYESKRLAAVGSLENEIKDFVEYTVNYSNYKTRFAKLCYRLSLFYNTLLNSYQDNETIRRQWLSAHSSLNSLYTNVREELFFKKDSRKKEELLNHAIYADYILFKILLRSNDIQNISEFKNEKSEIFKLFTSTDYDNLILKFFVEDLERYQVFISKNFTRDTMYKEILGLCEKLQQTLSNYEQSLNNSSYLEELINFEDTCSALAKAYKTELEITPSNLLNIESNSSDIVSVKNIALSALKIIGSDTAILLHNVICNFRFDISWREFYFLCKIFDIYNDVLNVADTAIFKGIKANFSKYDLEYAEYSGDYIAKKKSRILNSESTIPKKYILLLTVSEQHTNHVKKLLSKLQLDFVEVDSKIFLNYSYFKGFKNLEDNFGNYTTF